MKLTLQASAGRMHYAGTSSKFESEIASFLMQCTHQHFKMVRLKSMSCHSDLSNLILSIENSSRKLNPVVSEIEW